MLPPIHIRQVPFPAYRVGLWSRVSPESIHKVHSISSCLPEMLGLRVHIYLYFSDWLIRGRSLDQVQRPLDLVCSICRDLGLMIHEKKSTLTPVQCIEFIRVVLDSIRTRAFLPETRSQAMADLMAGLRAHPLTTTYTCLRLLGHVAVYAYVAGVGPYPQPAQHGPGGQDPGQRTVVPHLVAGPHVSVGRSSLYGPNLVSDPCLQRLRPGLRSPPGCS